jgi:phytoene desaturase
VTAALSLDTVPVINKSAPTALVIGSGFGGLAAAIRLGARGYRVTVLEKLDCVGGRARVHRQGGFVFDAGPTIITAPFLLEELWALCGRKLSDDVELKLMSPFYRIYFDDGETFDYSGDPAKTRSEIERFSPEDVAGYARYMEASEAIYKVGFEQLAHVPFDSWRDMLRIAPDMMRLQSFRSVYGIVSKYIKNEYLRVVLSFHPLLIGGNPFATTSIYSLISFLERNYGVYSAVGGTGSIVQGLADLARGQGVEFQFDAEVAAIEVTGGRTTGVTLRNGQKIAADIVVSNADAAWTYKHLLPAKFRGRWGERRLQRAKYSNGLFVWYFGTNRRYDDIAHHSIVLGPRYRGLLDDIFDNKSLSSDFSLYLHRPTATDPSMAPQGCDAFYALSPVPNLDGNVDWQEVAEDYRAAIERRLEEKLLPGLKDAVVESRVTTPLDFEQQLCAYRGAGFSLQPLLTQSAWFRPHNRSKDVEGLFFVGAGTHPGAGIPGVLSSAKILESVIPHASQFH